MHMESRSRSAVRSVLALLALLTVSTSALASTVTVDATANSSNAGSGTGANTGLVLSAGDWFQVTVPTTDLWNAGPLKRWSNADGLIVNLFATGTDDSGYAGGTHIGEPFALYTNSGLTAPYGALVGRIGAGAYFLIGTSFLGQANAAGTLSLFYWDSNSGDNSQFITATVNAVPLPAAGWLLLSGLAAFAAFGRRRPAADVGTAPVAA